MSAIDVWARALLKHDAAGLHTVMAHTTRCVVGGRETIGAEAAALMPLPPIDPDALTTRIDLHTDDHDLLVMDGEGARVVGYVKREGDVMSRAWLIIEGPPLGEPTALQGIAVAADQRLSQLPPTPAFQAALHRSLSSSDAADVAPAIAHCAPPGLRRAQAFVIDAASFPNGWAAAVRWQGEAGDAGESWRPTGLWSVIGAVDGAPLAAFDPIEPTSATPLPFG